MNSTELRELFPPEIEARMKKAGCWPTRMQDDGDSQSIAFSEWEDGDGHSQWDINWVSEVWESHCNAYDAANALRVACEDWLIAQGWTTITFQVQDGLHYLGLHGNGGITLFDIKGYPTRLHCFAHTMNTELPRADA